MKKSLNIIASFCLFLAAPLLAQGTTIAVVDAETVIQSSIKGKRFFTEMENFGKKRTEEIKAKVDQLREKDKEFQAKVNSLSEDKRKSMQQEMQKLDTEIKRMQEDAKRESDMRVNDALDNFRRELIPVIEQVAKARKAEIVLNIGPGSNIAYLSPTLDITPEVVKAYDATVKE
jgi:Skp family chaperone for outer membrane proteins